MAKFLFTQFQNVELIVENGNPIGGAVVETMVWVKALHELGHEILQFKYENDDRKPAADLGWIELLPVFHPSKGVRWLRWMTYRLPQIFKALKKNQPDYLYESIPGWSTFYTAQFCKILGIKMILRVASDVMLDERIKTSHSKFDWIFIARAFKSADMISVQNDFQFQTLRKRFPNKKIIKIYNPIVIESTKQLPKMEMKGYMAWVADFRYPKNLKLLFEVATALPEEKFRIAGVALRNMDSETEEFLGKLKTLSNVVFVGQVPREDIFSFLSGAKFLLSTSRYEGFSNTFLEAMVVGTPILTPTMVNPDGIITMFDLGITYNTAVDLKEHLNKITLESYLAKSKNCLQFVKENHDHLILASRLVEFLKS